jgi:hypothetical protein
MKEISEEWQYKMFDLLEGNLSESEKLALLQQIQNDSDLQREFQLLQATYLSPDETEVYPFKEKLLKQSRNGFWVKINRSYFAAAASVVLIFGLLIAIRFNSQKGSTTPPNFAAQKPQTNIEPINKQAPKQPIQIKKEVQPVFHSAFNPPTESKTNLTAPLSDSVMPSFTATSGQLNIEKKGLTEVNISLENAHLHHYRVWVYYPSDMPVSGTKKRTLSYKLLKATRTMLATLNLPSVSIKAKPIKGKFIPAFDIKVQLPFNENNILANYNE